MALSSLLPFGNSGPTAMKVDDMLARDLYDRSRETHLQSVRPYKDTENGLKRGTKLLTALHDPDPSLWGMHNTADPLAFELHYDANTELLQPRVAAQSEDQFELVDRGDRLVLVPVAEDPLEALREEFRDVDGSAEELKQGALDEALDEAGS